MKQLPFLVPIFTLQFIYKQSAHGLLSVLFCSTISSFFLFKFQEVHTCFYLRVTWLDFRALPFSWILTSVFQSFPNCKEKYMQHCSYYSHGWRKHYGTDPETEPFEHPSKLYADSLLSCSHTIIFISEGKYSGHFNSLPYQKGPPSGSVCAYTIKSVSHLLI